MIEITDVKKSFSGLPVLKGIDLAIPDGSRTCIVGGSGSGKSVLIKLVLGLIPLDEGNIFIDGENTRTFDLNRWNRLFDQFGVVFQGSALFDSLTIWENVGMRMIEARTFTDEEIKEKVSEILEEVRLGPEVMDKYPAELSGGMRKRVAIARAVVHQPRYVIYDEPTSGLDPVSAGVVDELMEKLSDQPGRTTLIITHDMYTVRKLASQVALLYQGKLHFVGTPSKMWESDDPIIREFLAREMES